jgi:serine/threonine protein kinase
MAADTSKPALQAVGNYDIVEKIAEGGMGAIYKGRHRDSGQIVAIKVMPAHMASNDVLVKRFEQEFRAASLLDHPNMVRALDFGYNGTTPFLVMEFVEGESLGKRLHKGGRLPEEEAIRIIKQVAYALYQAHKQGLIHRDVKPDNILVTPDGQAKLADLGLVKEVDAELNLTKTGRGLGTPHFMAPEQFRNAKHADIRCDIYSLGATLYQMVTGELPFKSTGPLDAWMKKMQNDLVPPRKIVPELSERAEAAIRRAMSPEPEKRPATCREFVEDLTGPSTRKGPSAEGGATPQDIWYLVYKDDEGNTHTVKGTTAAIRSSLKDGLLGDASNVRACRTKAGPFELLRSFAEFHDLVGGPAATTPPAMPPTTPETPASRPTVRAHAAPTTTRPAVPTAPEAPARPEEAGAASEHGWLVWVLLAGVVVLAAVVIWLLFFNK